MKALRLLLPAVILAAGACTRGEHLNGVRPPHSSIDPRSAYAVREGAADAAAMNAWDAAGSNALRARLYVQPGFEEVLVFPKDATIAATYRFRLGRGDRLEVEIRTERGEAPFVDVFEVMDSSMFRHVFAPVRGVTKFSYTSTSDGEHVLRVQPAIQSGGRYAVRVGGSAAAFTMTFPVAGETAAAITGQWGDARDGGARSHKGVDIFAPRGTAVVAVADGTIIKVETTPTGGRVIWERDEARGLLYFYAHLDEQIITEGSHVAGGELIGRVGNTGNASGGSTHLHFGVFLTDYVAQNPTPYLLAKQPAGDGTAPIQLGTRVRLTGDHVRLRNAPAEGGPVIEQLDAGTELLMLGFVNGWSRVVLSDGTTGFIAGWLLSGERSAGTHQ